MEEIEVKFLNIDAPEIERKLAALGAKKVFDRVFQSRTYDYPDLRLHRDAVWIRIRDEGDKVTLAYKKRLGAKTWAKGDNKHEGQMNDDGMEEVELVVSDLETMAHFFYRIGLKQKFREEKQRIRYVLDNIEFDIDYIPLVPPYLEIEAKSWEEIDKAISLLGLNPDDKKIFSATQIYKLNGIRQLDYTELTFDHVTKRETVATDD